MKNLSEKRRVKSEESNSYVKVKNPIVKRAHGFFTLRSSLFTLKINCYGECYYEDCE